MSMVTIEVDFWGRPTTDGGHTVGVDMPGTAGRTLVAAIRAGKIAPGYGRGTGNLTYGDLAQGYDAAAAGARANGDAAGAEAHAASARRMRETATIISTFGSLRDAAGASAERSTVLTVAELAETYSALGNQWGARMVRVAADLSMDMDGQPTLFDAPADPNAPFTRKRAGRKAPAKSAKFDAATVKRLSAKLPAVYLVAYGPTGTPTGRDTMSVTNVPAHLGRLPGANLYADCFPAHAVPAPARKRTAPAGAPAEAPAPHGFIALTGTRRCATCDRGRTAKCHAEAPAQVAQVDAPAEAPATTTEESATMIIPTRDNWNGHGQPSSLTYYGRGKTPAITGRVVNVQRHGFNGMTLVDPFGETVDSMGGTAKFWAAPVPAGAAHLVATTEAPAPAEAEAPAEAPAQVAQVDAPAEAPAQVAQVDAPAEAPAPAVTVDAAGIDRDALALVAASTWSSAMIGKAGAREGVHVLSLPAGYLARPRWCAVRDLVAPIGGHWSKEARGFVFPKSRPCFPNNYTRDGRADAEAWIAAAVAAVAEAPAPAEAPAQVAQVAQVDAPAPAVGTTEAPADQVAQVAEALRAAVRAPGVAFWMHVKTGSGKLGSRAAWCSHLVGPLGVDYARSRTVASDELSSGAAITCPACSHLVMCRASGCVTCAAILGACDRDGCELCTDARPAGLVAEAPAPAEAPATTEAPAQVDAPAEAPAPVVRPAAWMVAAVAGRTEAPAPVASTVTAPDSDNVTTWAPAPAEAPATTEAPAQVDAPAEAPAQVDAPAVAPAPVAQVDAPADIPAGARPAAVDVTDRGTVDGFAFRLRPGSTTMQLGKAVRRDLGAHRAELGGLFTVTAPRGSRTVSVVPADGAKAPADWSAVLSRVASILGDAVDAEAPAES